MLRVPDDYAVEAMIAVANPGRKRTFPIIFRNGNFLRREKKKLDEIVMEGVLKSSRTERIIIEKQGEFYLIVWILLGVSSVPDPRPRPMKLAGTDGLSRMTTGPFWIPAPT